VKNSLPLLLTLVVAGCRFAPAPQPAPGPTPAAPDAGSVDAARLDAAAKACRHLRELHCATGNPTAAGTSCESVLRGIVVSRASRVDVPCLATVKSCTAQSACTK
jgi:hypothetical protein